MSINTLRVSLSGGVYDRVFTALYGSHADLAVVRARYLSALDGFEKVYGGRLPDTADIRLFSVPGRSEISGNHTDHNHGKVLAASVSLDVIAVAAVSGTDEIRILSEGFPEDVVSLADVSTVRKEETYKASAIIRGMCDGFVKNGHAVGGFYAYTTSNVLKGSGLSSSAAFEVMVGNLLNHFFNGGTVNAIELAKLAQYAENVHFGKPCGLMDQMACAVGGFVAIDFADPADPVVERLPFDLAGAGLSLCIVNTGGNHADLNEDYASVPADMKKTAAYLGVSVLVETTKECLLEHAAEIRQNLGDRCFLRSLHYFNENERVENQRLALERNDVDAFLDGVKASGRSSWCYLQNVYTVKNVTEQGLSVALALTSELLDNVPHAAYRVHGGGFAGTIQAFVPHALVPSYCEALEKVFGKGSVYVLAVRPFGAVRLDDLLS